MWRKYFKIKGIKPGVVVYPRPFGEIDFRDDNLDPELLLRILEDDRNLLYLHLTDEGINHFYPDNEAENDQTEDDDQPDNTEQLFKAKDLVKAIKESETEEDARYFFGLGKEYKSVQTAFDKKIEELNSEH